MDWKDLVTFSDMLEHQKNQDEKFKVLYNRFTTMETNIKMIMERLEGETVPNIEHHDVKLAGAQNKALVHFAPMAIKSATAENLYKLALKEFSDTGSEISINGDLTNDKDEWIQQRDTKAILMGIKRYLKDTGRTDLNIKMICVYEHSSEFFMKYHFHGIFKGIPNDCMAVIRKYCAARCGRTEIKMIKDQDNYLKYMFKSYIPNLYVPPPPSKFNGFKSKKIHDIEYFHPYDHFTIGFTYKDLENI